MSHFQESIGEHGLHCFGAISASMSHELKNVLAIINENAGLLEDLSLMAERGHPLDPVKLKLLAGNVARQIKRADGIIKNMNHFAHSIDDSVKCINLGEILELTVFLSSRMAAMKNITVILAPPSSVTVYMTTHPFFLINLIWLCFKEFFERLETEKQIVVSHMRTPEGISLVVTPVDSLLTDENTGNLLNFLKATQKVHSQNRNLILFFPVDISIC